MSIFSHLRRARQARRVATATQARQEQWQSDEDRIIASTPLRFGDLPDGMHKGCGGSVERTSLGAGYTSQFCRSCQRFLPVEEVE